MNLKRSMMYILVVMVSVNAFSMMLDTVGIGPIGVQPSFNQTQLETNLDANLTLTDYAWTSPLYSDFVYGALTFLGVAWGLVTGFPTLLITAGVPTFITDPFYIVWLLVTFIAMILGVIGGQDT